MAAIRPTREGVTIAVRVRPRSRAALAVRDGVLVVSVAAPAVDGRATEEARRAVADALGLPASAVVLRSGARARDKVFAAAGISVEGARLRLAAATR